MHYFISFWKNQKLESCSAIRSLGENLTLKKRRIESRIAETPKTEFFVTLAAQYR